MKKIVALTGSLSTPSRTRSLVETIAHRLAQQWPASVHVIDIAELASELGHAVSFNSIPAAVTRAHQLLAQADVLVLASPVYKGSYSGLFKHFLDLLDPNALRGKVTLLAATGGSDRHALVLEHQLRPLASFFEVVTVPSGVYARDSDFVNYQLQLPEAVQTLARIDLAVAQAVSLLHTAQAPALALAA
jgi:FMN reductase